MQVEEAERSNRSGLQQNKTSISGRGQEVVFQDVTKRFDDEVVAVDALSLEILPGEFFTLLGPSGSGKTTLLNLVLGVLDPDEGRSL